MWGTGMDVGPWGGSRLPAAVQPGGLAKRAVGHRAALILPGYFSILTQGSSEKGWHLKIVSARDGVGVASGVSGAEQPCEHSSDVPGASF